MALIVVLFSGYWNVGLRVGVFPRMIWKVGGLALLWHVGGDEEACTHVSAHAFSD